MLKISANKRELSEKTDLLRNNGLIPAVLYGPKIENENIKLNRKEFNQIHEEAGENTLISLTVNNKEFPVLIHDIKRDPLTNNVIHIDFYQPILTEEVEVAIPLVFDGEAPAVKDLGGTLVKSMQEITVKALPQDLPHEIKIDVSGLNTFEDEILVSSIKVNDKVTIMKDGGDLITSVKPAADIDSELEKPIESEEESKTEEEAEATEKTEGEKPQPEAGQPTAEETERKK